MVWQPSLLSTLQLEKHAVPFGETIKSVCPVPAGEKKRDFSSRGLWFMRSACKDRFKTNANQHKCFSHSSSPEKVLINYKITLKPIYINLFISQSFTKPTLKSQFVSSFLFCYYHLDTPLKGWLTGIIPLAVLENVVYAHAALLG